MILLGLETSCDETAVGIVDDTKTILANQIATQIETHRPYGGVVPEIAARAHLAHVDALIRAALQDAGLTLGDLSGIAATTGPGLIGGVMVGAMAGKALASVTKKPFLGINHLEAHALIARLTNDVAFPYLLLLVSGGHCQLLLAQGVGRFRALGTTIDDAVGEAFDKSAKLLGLGYPGGPLIEQAALRGNPKAFDLPRPLLGRAGCDFSFSGLKTAVRHLVQAELAQSPALSPAFVADCAASLQAAIADTLADRTKHALALTQGDAPTALVVGGGVAANAALRTRLAATAAAHGLPFFAPPPALCTDNGVMVAWAGLEHLRLGHKSPLSLRARPRWPLEELGQAFTA